MFLWTFKGFVDDRDFNVMDEWYKELPEPAKAKLDWILEFLKTRPQNEWIAKYFKKLDERIYEIRFEVKNIAYRPLGSFAPMQNDFTFLIGVTKKNNILNPKGAVKTAFKRLKFIDINQSKARECEFDD